MNAPRSRSQKSAIFETLDNLFFSLIDEARSAGLTARPWPELIGVIALRFIGGIHETPDEWAMTLEIPSTRSGAVDFFQRVSEKLERANAELEHVFTKALLAGIERIDAHVLNAWAFRLARLSPVAADRELFGQWLDDLLANTAIQPPELGQFATPPSVARLMVRLADLAADACVLDPCCGIGGVLSAAIARSHENDSRVHVFGQELLPVNWALCRLRLFALGQNASSIILGDSLRQPAFAEGANLRQFDCVLCDPPLGLTLYDPDLAFRDTYDRFIYSAPGRGPAEAAFVQHAVASMRPAGKAVLLVSHGFLFRLGNDARVREGLVRSGKVHAIIGLPGKLRSSTAIESALVVLGKNPTGEIIVIDASRLHSGPSRGRAQLSDGSIDEITQIVANREIHRAGIARMVTTEELAKSDFSFLPRRYIWSPGPEDIIADPVALREELRGAEETARRAAADMDSLLEEFIV